MKTLTVSDDGKGASIMSLDTFARAGNQSVEGHHGLQGIRERLEVLGGEVEAKPAEAGGFIVTLRLPYELYEKHPAQKERTV